MNSGEEGDFPKTPTSLWLTRAEELKQGVLLNGMCSAPETVASSRCRLAAEGWFHTMFSSVTPHRKQFCQALK
jgi:hypothetical protein